MKVTDSLAACRALAHPARRQLVALLEGGPRTTGQLASAFPVSRFAVMKHLAVLERSGLVAVRRRGRERWNELIGQASERPQLPTPTPGEHASCLPDVPSRLTPFAIARDVLLGATPDLVFDALTLNVAAWWGPPYLRSPQATHVGLEAHLGGRLYEEWGHRQGFIRGLVTAVRQDRQLQVTGTIAGPGPWPAILEFRLRPDRDGTCLSVVHRGVALVQRQAGAEEAAYAAAWSDLFSVRLRAFVERGVRSGIGEQQGEGESLSGFDGLSTFEF